MITNVLPPFFMVHSVLCDYTGYLDKMNYSNATLILVHFIDAGKCDCRTYAYTVSQKPGPLSHIKMTSVKLSMNQSFYSASKNALLLKTVLFVCPFVTFVIYTYML